MGLTVIVQCPDCQRGRTLLFAGTEAHVFAAHDCDSDRGFVISTDAPSVQQLRLGGCEMCEAGPDDDCSDDCPSRGMSADRSG
jgi:hypothetical protein